MKSLTSILLSFIFFTSCITDKTPVVASLPGENGVFWKQTAGPYGGTIMDIAISSSNEMYAATQYNGVFRSADGGKIWTKTNPERASLEVIATNSQGHVFTGDPDIGLLRSVDKGKSWTRITPDSVNMHVYAIGINQIDHIFIGGPRIYFSRDDGSTWEKTDIPQDNFLTSSIDFNIQGHVFIGTNKGIFRSLDEGVTWAKVLDSVRVYSLLVNGDKTIFALEEYGAVYRSTDNGNSWQKLSGVSGNCFTSNLQENIFLGSSDSTIWISTDNGNNWNSIRSPSVFLTTISVNDNNRIFSAVRDKGIFLSDDYGTTWDQTGIPLIGVLSLAVSSSNQIFAGTDRGIFLSIDNGNYWKKATPEIYLYVYSIAVSENNGYIFAATNDGVYRSTDNGSTWNHLIAADFSSHFLDIKLNYQGDIFALGQSGVYRSIDNGESWTNLFYPGYALSMVIDKEDHIYIGLLSNSPTHHGGLYISTDNGENWSYSKAGFDAPVDIIFLYNSANNEIYAGTSDGIYKFDRDVGKFRKLSAPDYDVISITENSANVLFIGTIEQGVYISKDNGGTWKSLNDGLILDYFTSITALVCDSKDIVFAGTSHYSVFRSSNPLR